MHACKDRTHRPSLLGVSSEKRGTMRAPVAMASSSISTPPTHRTCPSPTQFSLDSKRHSQNSCYKWAMYGKGGSRDDEGPALNSRSAAAPAPCLHRAGKARDATVRAACAKDTEARSAPPAGRLPSAGGLPRRQIPCAGRTQADITSIYVITNACRFVIVDKLIPFEPHKKVLQRTDRLRCTHKAIPSQL